MEAAMIELTGGIGARLAANARPAVSDGGVASGAAADDSEAVESVGKGDSITLSSAAQSVLNGEGTAPGGEDAPSDREREEESDKDSKAAGGAPRAADGEQLDEAEVKEVERLKERDREVRTHEQAHQAAGGPHAGSPSYDYETGPDGRSYATSGEVPIDIAPVAGNPAATVAKMEQVKRAALAPAEPSGADRAIAAKAEQTKLKAQRELAEQQLEPQESGHGDSPSAAPRGTMVSVTA